MFIFKFYYIFLQQRQTVFWNYFDHVSVSRSRRLIDVQTYLGINFRKKAVHDQELTG